MRDFTCFGENGVQIADSSSSIVSRTAQNLVSCIYHCKLLDRSCLITITWTKNLMGQSLGISIDDSKNQSLCKVDIKPWLFSKRKGCKNIGVDSGRIDIYWDFCNAKFGSGPEPLEEFYLAIVFNNEMVLLLGDLKREAYKKVSSTPVPFDALCIAKREHVFGKKSYGVKAQFCNKGRMHDLKIECDTAGLGDSRLVIRVDSKAVMQVKHLRWKFRGNHTIFVDGLPVEVFWDVHNWLFGNAMGNAVFMFQTCLSSEKLWDNQPENDPAVLALCYSQNLKDAQFRSPGFSLILYAWRSE